MMPQGRSCLVSAPSTATLKSPFHASFRSAWTNTRFTATGSPCSVDSTSCVSLMYPRSLSASSHCFHGARGGKSVTTTRGDSDLTLSVAYPTSLPVRSWVKDVDQMNTSFGIGVANGIPSPQIASCSSAVTPGAHVQLTFAPTAAHSRAYIPHAALHSKAVRPVRTAPKSIPLGTPLTKRRSATWRATCLWAGSWPAQAKALRSYPRSTKSRRISMTFSISTSPRSSASFAATFLTSRVRRSAVLLWRDRM